MAEQIVFGDDLDNVTVKNINGKLTAVVNVENAEDEFEVVTDYVEPQEDDEYYVESVFAKFRHKATQLLTDAYKKEKKPRSAPVNESLVNPLTATVSTEHGVITIMAEGNAVSQVDGKSLAYSDYNPANTYVEVNKSDYANAKAFNAANAGKTFTVTTAKRYAESEGHPVVKPTEIQVAYPTLPYEEYEYAPETGVSSYSLEYAPDTYDSNESATKRELLTLIDSAEHEVSYVVRYADNTEISGTHTYSGKYLNRFDVSGYRNEQAIYEKWEFKPYVVENFSGEMTVSPKTYKEEIDTL